MEMNIADRFNSIVADFPTTGNEVVKAEAKVVCSFKPLDSANEILVVVNRDTYNTLCCLDLDLKSNWEYRLDMSAEMQFFDFDEETVTVSGT